MQSGVRGDGGRCAHQNHSLPKLGTENTPQWMKMPNLAWSNQAGSWRASRDSQVGSKRAAPPTGPGGGSSSSSGSTSPGSFGDLMAPRPPSCPHARGLLIPRPSGSLAKYEPPRSPDQAVLGERHPPRWDGSGHGPGAGAERPQEACIAHLQN